MKPTSVELPVPPSVNHLYEGTGKRRHRTKAYQSWGEVAILLARAGLGRYGAGPVAVRITFRTGAGWDPRRDVDNGIKAVVDLLKHAGTIADDNYRIVRRLEIDAVDGDGRPAACIVEVRSLTEILEIAA